MVDVNKKLRVLFVCIGNSCRSPMAESIMKNIIENSSIDVQWEIDSAAIASWNVGLSPEPRCLLVLEENGLTSNHIGRQIKLDDFYKFDFIFGMDYSNINDLNRMMPADSKAKIELLGSYDVRNEKTIVDPYFENGINGFYRCFDQITKSCKKFYELQTL